MRRRIFLLGLIGAPFAIAGCGGGNPVSQLIAAGHKPPFAPSQLRQIVNGQPIEANGWTNQATVQLGAELTSPETGATLVAEAEFRPAASPFTGSANAVGARGEQFVTTPAMAPGQHYHWQLRARDVGGPASPWVPFEGALGYDPAPPPSPSIQPLPNGGWVTQKQAKLSWDAVAGRSGIAGYALSLDRAENGQPPQDRIIKETSATVNVPQDGDWFFHVRTLDRAGNWSLAATLPLHVDSLPLKVTDPLYRTFAYNPDFHVEDFEQLHIGFSINKPATVTVIILPDKADTLVRTMSLGQQPAGKVQSDWDGKDDQGAPAKPGNYRFRVVARDQAGNIADAVYDKLLISQKRIVVSLSQQKMWAYDADKLFLDSLVTTGGPLLPTPEGTFQVLTKQTKFTFKSPWPKGSPFWYPDSPTSFAMMFDDVGYFIHDAPWRRRFGPGSNLVPGQPGEETSGTHGCVNVPLDAQTKLFAWTDFGTPVVVQQ